MKTSKLSYIFLDVMIATECDLPNSYRSVDKFEIDLRKEIECSHERMRGILELLEDERLIRFGDTHRSAFRLLEKGFAYKEFRWMANREQWKERFIGFMSGVLTAIFAGIALGLI